MRVPQAYFQTLLGYPGPPLEHPGVTRLDPSPPLTVGGANSLRNPALFAIDALLTRKLGLAEALTMGRFTAEATGTALALDLVDDPLGTGQAEWTAMITYTLTVTSGVSEFPAETASYSRLLWAPADRLGEAYASHDALILDDSLDPFEVCISGLCIRSAVFAVHHGQGSPRTQMPSVLEARTAHRAPAVPEDDPLEAAG